MNPELFSTEQTVINKAGGKAFELTPEQALARYAATGCFNDIYYVDSKEQLEQVLEFCKKVTPAFVAKLAIYARTSGYMKDMPAFLTAYLSTVDTELMKKVFPVVIDNGKMLRNFVQIIRSGVLGRKSLGSAPKKCIQKWFESRSADTIFRQSIGNKPSLGDVIRMVHPKPENPEKKSLYAYLLGREVSVEELYGLVKEYEFYKTNPTTEDQGIPDVPFQFLTALPLSTEDWKNIARNATWQTTRMNLNTFLRHGVFTKNEKPDAEMINLIANRLKDPETIKKAKVFPYQIMTAYLNLSAKDIPFEIREALQDAMEIAVENTPVVEGDSALLVDISGSMQNPVTGDRGSATTKTTCVHVAALITSAFLRKNPRTQVVPFNSEVVTSVNLNPRDTVITNAQLLTRECGGGTDCLEPFQHLLDYKRYPDFIFMISDDQAWLESVRGFFDSEKTEAFKAWKQIKKLNPKAKMVCLNLQPYKDTQIKPSPDVLLISGFSDQVFTQIQNFLDTEKRSCNYWVDVVNSIKMD